MFLSLNHQRLGAFKSARALVLACFQASKALPESEKFGMIPQLRRAALSVYLNLAEGCARKSTTEHKRLFEIARASVVEIDAILDIAIDLGYCQKDELKVLGGHLLSIFRLISLILK